MIKIKKTIDQLLQSGIEQLIFPSCSAGIWSKNNNKHFIVSEYKYLKKGKYDLTIKKYYDLASLTKPLSTVLSIISLIGEGKITLHSRVSEYLPWDVPEDKREITIRELLNHSSGLPAHRPYYEELMDLPEAARKEEMGRLILAEKMAAPPGTAAIYSDLGYLLLGMIIEELSGVGLEQYFTERIAGPLGLGEGIFYKPLKGPKKSQGDFFPTENCPWRGKVLQGEVSDENCWVLGGVAGHAGLFGDIESVLALVCAILDIWQGRKVHPNIRREDLAIFLEEPSRVTGSTWALGFDRPTPGSSSSGKYLSPRSVGHLGFTGTSFWIDPDKGLVIVLLTNRVHPSRENNKIREFRPLFHDRVVELLGLV